MTDEIPRRPTAYYDSFKRDGRRFRLVRSEDESGVSGTGIVAVGVEFPSGAAVIEWLNDTNDDLDVETNGLAIKPGPHGVRDTVEVHGHGGRTRVEYVDESRAVREGDACLCYSCGDEFPVEVVPEDMTCPTCGGDIAGANGG